MSSLRKNRLTLKEGSSAGARYIHFTDEAGMDGIIESGEIWSASFGPAGSVFAVIEGGSWTPGVQRSSMGRAKNRDVALVFTTPYLPDLAQPEEVMWHMSSLPVSVIDVYDLTDAKGLSAVKGMLSDALPADDEMDMLAIPHHPAFDIWGDWTRMPDDFKSWTPGRDNDKYERAYAVWHETQNIDDVRDIWENKSIEETVLRILIREIVSIGPEYQSKEAAKNRVQNSLLQKIRKHGDPASLSREEYRKMATDAANEVGVTNRNLRDMIINTMISIPPHILNML